MFYNGRQVLLGGIRLGGSTTITFVLWAAWESFASTFFRCTYLLYCMLEFFGVLWIIIVELFKLSLVFDPIDEVIYHLLVCDIKDLGSYFSKVVIILLEVFIWFLFASSKLVLGTWVGEDATKIFTEFALKLFPSIDGIRL